MKRIIIIIFSIFSLLSCSNKSKVSDLADKIILLSKNKEFKEIYKYMTSDDRESIDQDSFYVQCYKYYEEMDSLGSLTFIDTEIEELSDDTVIVKKIAKLPDYELIKKIKSEKEEIKNLINRMSQSKSLPTKIDTFQLRFIRENDGFKFDVGYKRQKIYLKMLEERKSKFYNEKVEISAKKIELNKTYYSDYESAKIYAEIKNLSDCLISAVSCDFSIDDIMYEGPYLGSIYFSIDLGPKQIQNDYAYISGEIEKKLFTDYYPVNSTIDGKRINLIIKYVYFKDECSKAESEVAINAFKDSGFNKNSIGFVPTIAALSN